MATPKKYFHDRLVLLLLSINAFFAIVFSLYIILRVDFGESLVYVSEYRDKDRLGLRAFSGGSANDLLAFVFFAVAVTAFNVDLSKKVLPIRRHVALVLLGMTTLLLILCFIVTDLLITRS